MKASHKHKMVLSWKFIRILPVVDFMNRAQFVHEINGVDERAHLQYNFT